MIILRTAIGVSDISDKNGTEFASMGGLSRLCADFKVNANLGDESGRTDVVLIKPHNGYNTWRRAPGRVS